MAERLTDEKLHQELQSLVGWTSDGKQIEREFTFKDFAGALQFVNRVGEKAEAADHHPDILLHGWNKVKIMLSTHSAGGITQKDVHMARQVSAVA